MRVGPSAAGAARKREGIDHRAGPLLEVEVVKGAQHALGVRDRRLGIPRSWGSLASPRVRCGLLTRRRRVVVSPSPVRAKLLRGEREPAAEVPGLDSRCLVPIDPDRCEEAEPAQKIHPIGALGRRRASTGGEFAEICGRGCDRGAISIEHAVGLEEIPRRLERSQLGHREVAQVSRARRCRRAQAGKVAAHIALQSPSRAASAGSSVNTSVLRPGTFFTCWALHSQTSSNSPSKA